MGYLIGKSKWILLCILFALIFSLWRFSKEESHESSGLNHNYILGPATKTFSSTDCNHTIVSPHMNARIIDEKNIVYSADFQAAWDEFKTINGGPIKMNYLTSHTLYLNSSENILKNSEFCYSSAGIFTNNTSKKIMKDLQLKFNNHSTPELLPKGLPFGSLYTYSYLFVNVPFKNEFEILTEPLEFQGKKVQAFGIKRYDSSIKKNRLAANQVYYCELKTKKINFDSHPFGFDEDNHDFIVRIETSISGHTLILARIEPKEDLFKTIAYILNAIKTATFQRMVDGDILIIPQFSFDLLWNYGSLCFNPIISTNPEINGKYFQFSLHYISFRLNERGVILKAESIEALCKAPNLTFDKPFLLMLIEDGAQWPYFAMWVNNPELMIPWGMDMESHS